MSIGYVLERGCDLDVALFPSWLQGITGKSAEKSENNLFDSYCRFPICDPVDMEIMERGLRGWFYPVRPWTETKQGWFEPYVGGRRC